MPINCNWVDNALLEIIDKYDINGVSNGDLNKDYKAIFFPEELHPDQRGGLSEKPCFKPSNELIRRTRRTWKNRFTKLDVEK